MTGQAQYGVRHFRAWCPRRIHRLDTLHELFATQIAQYIHRCDANGQLVHVKDTGVRQAPHALGQAQRRIGFVQERLGKRAVRVEDIVGAGHQNDHGR